MRRGGERGEKGWEGKFKGKGVGKLRSRRKGLLVLGVGGGLGSMNIRGDGGEGVKVAGKCGAVIVYGNGEKRVWGFLLLLYCD